MSTTSIKLLTEQELMEIFGGKTNWGTLVGSCVAGVGQDWISQR